MLFIRDENETSKFAGEGRKKTLKSIPWRQSQSAESLRHSTLDKFDYDWAIIHIGINDILQSKNISVLKELPNIVYRNTWLGNTIIVFVI